MAMAWLRVELSEEQQRVVNAERDEHPCGHVRRKMLVLWLLHHGIRREQAATIAGLGRATVQRYVAAFRDGGLDGLRRWGVRGRSATSPPMPRPSRPSSPASRCAARPKPARASSV
jgi:hypothetical protein